MIQTTKKLTLDQLQQELTAAGLDVSNGLGTIGAWVFPWGSDNQPQKFTDEVKAQSVIDAHVAMRPLTDEELNIQYATAREAGDQATVNHVLAQAHGLVPRDRVPL